LRDSAPLDLLLRRGFLTKGQNSLITLESYLFARKTEMPSAFVLFNVESGSEEQILKIAKDLGGVEEAYVSYGVYDLVMRVKAESMEKLKELVTHKLRTIKNVRSTLTLILTEE